MKWSLGLRLSLMMFLQFAIWGAWLPFLPAYLQIELGFSGMLMGWIFAALPLACMISPFIGGQIADRWVPSELFMAIANLGGGAMMLIMAWMKSFPSMFVLLLLFSFFYAPTLALSNSICFHHLDDPDKQFPWIRVWGSIGWIVAGLVLSLWLHLAGGSRVEKGYLCLLLAGIFAVLLGILSFFLPHTPPAKKKERPWAFLEALKLMKDWRFATFIIIAFIVSTQLQFYYMLTSPFLISIGVPEAQVPAWMTLAQVVEALVMFSLGFVLARFGYRKALVLGVIAWPIRYIVYAIGKPTWLVLVSQGLHGFGYVFFFVLGIVYVNSVSASDIRASAQGLWTFITVGIGMLVGALFTGWIRDLLTTAEGVNYTAIFLVPVFLTVACAIAYLTIFRESPKAEEPEAGEEST